MSAIVPLTREHLADCIKLSIEAGWNQTARDWEFILDEGEVFGILGAKRVIASAAILPYPPRFAWICMMLVTAAERRKGHARTLIGFCLSRVEKLSLVAGLDATPQGKEVYRKLGFKEIYAVTRWARSGHEGHASGHRHQSITPLGEPIFPAVIAYDEQRFGGKRGSLLFSLKARAPHLAHVAREAEHVKGFVLGREGQLATQIGPLVAADIGVARELLDAAVCHVEGACIIDAADHHLELRRSLEGLGFEPKRSFTRMLFGTQRPVDDPNSIFAIAGPEFA